VSAAPGPWSYDAESERLRDANGEPIGVMEPASGPLAAAAPLMLDALRRALRHLPLCRTFPRALCGEPGCDYCAARAAIVKATGGER
jgi:hypothetical protein